MDSDKGILSIYINQCVAPFDISLIYVDLYVNKDYSNT